MFLCGDCLRLELDVRLPLPVQDLKYTETEKRRHSRSDKKRQEDFNIALKWPSEDLKKWIPQIPLLSYRPPLQWAVLIPLAGNGEYLAGDGMGQHT
jgi:hypothetical protein